jgi:hypothetical protein
MAKIKHIYKILVRNPEGKMPLGKPSLRPENNIKMNLKEIGARKLTRFSWPRIGTGSRLLSTR